MDLSNLENGIKDAVENVIAEKGDDLIDALAKEIKEKAPDNIDSLVDAAAKTAKQQCNKANIDKVLDAAEAALKK